jgi:aspartokinase/homoserine dehydrogenase 1
MSNTDAQVKPVRVLKFGGTSVTGADRIDVIAQLVQERSRESLPVVVVSAFAGMTNALLEAAHAAARGAWRPQLQQIVQRHGDLADELLAPTRARAMPQLVAEADELARLLNGIELLGESSPRTLDLILSFGERLSALIVAQALIARGVQAERCDARALIVTDDHFGEAVVDTVATEQAVRRHVSAVDELQVVTGFIAATPSGATTTLGRGGSDYTAAIIGAALEAEAVEIWTDVPGVMSADPRLVPDAFPLRSLSYDELLELSHWEARVIHAPAVRALRDRNVPLYIRNSLRLTDPGTVVSAEGGSDERNPVRGIASVDQVHLIQLEGGGLRLGPGLVARVFEALARVRSKILLVSQASSERSICIAVHPDSVSSSLRAIDEEFRLEQQTGMLDPAAVEDACSIIAVVGEGMRERAGLSGRLFGVLGNHGINVRAIAQGSSELNISIVIDAVDEPVALRAIHDVFFAPQLRSAQLFLAGPGRVGSALLRQIGGSAEAARRLTVSGIARSGAAVIAPAGIDLAHWCEELEARNDGLHELVDAALNSPRHPRIFIDCTASEKPVAHYERLLRAGVAVVTANKTGFAGSAVQYRGLTAAHDLSARCYHETTVGAGLPILGTIEDLVRTGDSIQAVEGVLSGTVAYILDAVMSGSTFSAAVREAYERGYTEPDPRQDLSGLDVARKLLILGRQAGFPLEPDDVAVEPLVPDWSGATLDEFWSLLPGLDEAFAQLRADALACGQRLAYTGRVAPAGAAVRLNVVGPEHPCWSLRGSENLVVIVSDRYSDVPLVVRGPGAGPEVTAAGIYADILRARAEAGDAPVLASRTRVNAIRAGRASAQKTVQSIQRTQSIHAARASTRAVP